MLGVAIISSIACGTPNLPKKTHLFCRSGFGLVVSVVVPLMLAVLPYARGRGFDSWSRLRVNYTFIVVYTLPLLTYSQSKNVSCFA
jgi:hypothetical protein